MIEKAKNTSSEPWMSTYLHSKGNQLGLPISGTFELTARCNFNCKMCYVHQNDSVNKKNELTADQWLSLAKEASSKGMIFLLLTGGEPFLRSDFEEIYTGLIQMGIIVSINTNASLYDENIRRLFLKYPPSRINVTLYGGSKETYLNLCGNASFERVVNNLRSMKADGFQVKLNVSLTPYNVGDMEMIDAISREAELQAKASSYMYPPVRCGGETGYNSARFSAEDAGTVMARWNALRNTEETTLRKAEMILHNKSADLTDTCMEDRQEGIRCRAGRSSFWITWDGRMLPCGTMNIEASYPLSSGFDKAWEETRLRAAEIRLPKECSVCPNRENCAVCASSCKCETGRFDGKPEYICEMMKGAREETVRIAEKIKKEKQK